MFLLLKNVLNACCFSLSFMIVNRIYLSFYYLFNKRRHLKVSPWTLGNTEIIFWHFTCQMNYPHTGKITGRLFNSENNCSLQPYLAKKNWCKGRGMNVEERTGQESNDPLICRIDRVNHWNRLEPLSCDDPNPPALSVSISLLVSHLIYLAKTNTWRAQTERNSTCIQVYVKY